jgi:hypothetical protein
VLIWYCVKERMDEKAKDSNATDIGCIEEYFATHTDAKTDYDKIGRSILEGTAGWVLEEKSYKAWFEEDTPFLWISGFLAQANPIWRTSWRKICSSQPVRQRGRRLRIFSLRAYGRRLAQSKRVLQCSRSDRPSGRHVSQTSGCGAQ